MKTIAFFNNKGGIGKTSLVYHVAWMLSVLGNRVLVADLDPQAKLTSMFLSTDIIEEMWNSAHQNTIYGAIEPLKRGIGDIKTLAPRGVADKIHLVVGDLMLSDIEDQLSETWPTCLSRDERSFRVSTAFSRIIQGAGDRVAAEVALIDVGPNLGAINRSALVAADYVVVPISADLFAIRGLENVGPKLRTWREEWRERKAKAPRDLGFDLPDGAMEPLGYVVSRYSVFARGPVRAFQKWLDRAPMTYRKSMDIAMSDAAMDVETDPYKLAQVKDYRPLMPLAEEANKPMFLLKPADGAIGGHQGAVMECRADFQKLCMVLRDRIGLPAPLTLS